MAVDADRWFGPGEMSRKLGVTAKALRVYEREGLVTPVRGESGWRVYGPVQVARLHQIIALKDLGLSLKNIKTMIGGDQSNLRAILSMQHEALEEQRRKIDRGILLLTSARQKLDAGQTLSLDDLTNLTRETVIMTKSPMEALKVKFHAILAERMPEGEGNHWAENIEDQIAAKGINKAEMKAQFDVLMCEAARLMTSCDENSDEAKDLFYRMRALGASIEKPAKPVRDAIKAAFDEATADPEVSLTCGATIWMRAARQSG
jgi:DNA-binding transcriptional MerR regulator